MRGNSHVRFLGGKRWGNPPDLAVCRASCVKSQKSDRKALFYPANCQNRPDNRDFCVIGGAKIHKCNRLLADEVQSRPNRRPAPG
jgi:hypothetical protein